MEVKVVRLHPSDGAELYTIKSDSTVALPLFFESVPAGFPSPAEDYVEKTLDLNTYLISNPPVTFILKVHGNSMKDAGIDDGDLIIVDKSKQAGNNAIIVAMLNGGFTCKRLVIKKEKYYLEPANPDFERIEITEDMGFEVFGVVVHCIKSFKK